MKTLIWAAFAAFILSACSIPKFGTDLKTEIAEEAKPYVDKFIEIYKKPMPPLIVTIGDLDTGLAFCDRFDNGQKKIRIQKDSWETLCIAQKQAVIFHELGHCVLNRDHTENESISYMRTAISLCDFYEENEFDLINELFDIENKPMLTKLESFSSQS